VHGSGNTAWAGDSPASLLLPMLLGPAVFLLLAGVVVMVDPLLVLGDGEWNQAAANRRARTAQGTEDPAARPAGTIFTGPVRTARPRQDGYPQDAYGAAQPTPQWAPPPGAQDGRDALRTQPPVHGQSDGAEGDPSRRGEPPLAQHPGLDPHAGRPVASLPDLRTGDVGVRRGGRPAGPRLPGTHREAQLVRQELVAEGMAELGVGEQGADLADRFGGDQRVMAGCVHGREEAVAPRPPGGHREAGGAQALPAGEHGLGDG